jgi:hypothetical protein
MFLGLKEKNKKCQINTYKPFGQTYYFQINIFRFTSETNLLI